MAPDINRPPRPSKDTTPEKAHDEDASSQQNGPIVDNFPSIDQLLKLDVDLTTKIYKANSVPDIDLTQTHVGVEQKSSEEKEVKVPNDELQRKLLKVILAPSEKETAIEIDAHDADISPEERAKALALLANPTTGLEVLNKIRHGISDPYIKLKYLDQFDLLLDEARKKSALLEKDSEETPFVDIPLDTDQVYSGDNIDLSALRAIEIDQNPTSHRIDTLAEGKGLLKSLIERAKGKLYDVQETMRASLGTSERGEKLKAYFAERSESLQQKAKEYGSKIEEFVRAKGEEYNKLSFKKKLLVGGVLGIGAAAFSTVSTPLAAAFAVNLGIQRFGGMASMYVKFEEHLRNTVEGNSTGIFGRQEWYQNLFMGSSEKQRKVYAAIMAATYTAGMSLGIKEAVSVASESSYGEAVHQWLKQHYPFGETGASTTGGAVTDAAPSPSPHAPEAPAAVAEAVAPPLPSVEATAGHGYEYMTKRLWEQLQSQHLDASKFDPNSDIHKLLTADASTIDKVVHQIASDPQHGFFNPDGTSARIDLHSHMTIGTDGQLHMDSVVHAPEGASVTPSPHAETLTVPRPPEASISSHDVTPVPDTSFLARDDMEMGQSGHTVPSVESMGPDTTAPTNAAGEITLQKPEGPPMVDLTQSGETITNSFGLRIPINEPHIYADTGEQHLLVYGGTPQGRAIAIQEYLRENPTKVVFAQDDAAQHRILWQLVDGKATPVAAPIRTNGFFGLFSSFMKPPAPDELAKVIK